ncbi:MAG: Cof-type HAD-IIB family hydrolase [Peptoniphilaceae bacterium]|nr:Cof-type HAD-IIB family hydrolase [Peptoniphilaceae bacterium]MDY6019446.1 Cof-type HAD-IIB family hydrolase [Anaerococcus sp.]
MIKLVVSDIDETLICSNQTIHPRNKAAIKKAKDMGVKVILASGRAPYQLFNLLEELDIEKDDYYSILCNGGIIMQNSSKKIVESFPLGFTKAKKVYGYCFERKINCQIYTESHNYIYEPDTNLPKKDYPGLKYINTKDIDFMKDEIIIKVIIKNSDLNYLMSLEPDVANLCDWDVAISYSSDIYMEINAKNVNKGNALKKVCQIYGISIDETLAIGDNYNDIEMLYMAGKSAAVQNAHLQVKETADYITIATNNEGAVGEVIEKFVLNK